jgi:hypothetical protein
MKINHSRSLLASLMLAMVFTYSCSSDVDENHYYAEILESGSFYPYYEFYYNSKLMKPNISLYPYANMESYIFLYPIVTMESGGYFLNKMAKSEFIEDLCSYHINNLGNYFSPEVIQNYIHEISALGLGSPMHYCIFINKPDSFSGKMAEMKDWLKSSKTPFYNDINSEIFVEGNSKFLGFYKVNGQEHYIFVEERE